MKKTFLIAGSFLITIVVAIWMVRVLDVAQVRSVLHSVKTGYLLGAFLGYILLNVIRSYRFRVLLALDQPVRRIFPVVAIQNFFNVMLPFRLGEVPYLYWVHKQGIALGTNLASLISARFFDLVSIIAFFLVSSLFVPPTPYRSAGIVLGTVLILAGVAVVLWGSSIARRLPQNRIGTLVRDLIASFAQLRNRSMLLPTIIDSVLIWGLTFLTGLMLFRGVGLSLSPAEAFFVYTFPIIISMTPLYFTAGFGSYEASVTVGLGIVGVATAEAFGASVILHVTELLFVTVLGAAGYIHILWNQKSKR